MSRSKTWWTIALAAIVLAILGWLFWPTPEITNFPTSKRGPIVFVGDSLVSGVGASEGKSLPAQLSRLLGEPVLDYGVAGDTTRDGLARLAEPVAAQPRLALILLGGNDFLRRVERSQIEANLEQIVRSFQRYGAASSAEARMSSLNRSPSGLAPRTKRMCSRESLATPGL